MTDDPLALQIQMREARLALLEMELARVQDAILTVQGELQHLYQVEVGGEA